MVPNAILLCKLVQNRNMKYYNGVLTLLACRANKGRVLGARPLETFGAKNLVLIGGGGFFCWGFAGQKAS
jgi:hypothetical protein